MKKAACLITIVLIGWAMSSVCHAQLWAITYGGGNFEQDPSIQQTIDSGYIVGSETTSFVSGVGDSNIWIFKLNNDGSMAWEYTYGAADPEWFGSIQQTRDEGYIVAGDTQSFGEGGADLWVLKLDADGSIDWQKTYGAGLWEFAGAIQQTRDGGYILTGHTSSFGADEYDVWVLKLAADGAIQWQRIYNKTGYEGPPPVIRQTSDGGYILTAGTVSGGKWDLWMLKLDAGGNIVWQRQYGGTENDWANDVRQTSDGKYIVAGLTCSYNLGPVSGTCRAWVLKLNANGTIAWQNTYGPDWGAQADAVEETDDGSYIVAGSFKLSFECQDDLWLLKLDSNDGSIMWQYTYGDCNDMDIGADVTQTADGGYFLAGGARSFSGSHLDQDMWALKLSSSGVIPDCPYIKPTEMEPIATPSGAATTFAQAAVSTAEVHNTRVSPQPTAASDYEVCYSDLVECYGELITIYGSSGDDILASEPRATM